MEKIVLFCKSYKGDIERFKIQAESVRNHNRDNIPFYICIPKSDKNLFDPIVKKCNIKVFFDEDISNLTSEQSHFTQQLFKIEFMRSSNVAKHYFLMDSDMYFIKDFSISDFFNNGAIYDEVDNIYIENCHELILSRFLNDIKSFILTQYN